MLKNSLTVLEFCYSESISRSLFYKLLKQGNAPRLMKVGRRTLISSEAAKEWRARMEEAALIVAIKIDTTDDAKCEPLT